MIVKFVSTEIGLVVIYSDLHATHILSQQNILQKLKVKNDTFTRTKSL